ncbi:MAG: prepilin-type N-terminal cleavage/methylation domain-containing protein [Pirellulales bacterium]|nr:prepilin-type N-terminal cleavage/methylation domain-containing protein [Pirellulales bacterium]
MPRLSRRARGLTLLELLVSIMIMGIMIAVAVPVIRPPVDARSVKEAARMVSTALASARTKAIETGQSCGIEFTPLGGDPSQVGTLHICRVTAPYEGTDGVIAEDPLDSGSYTFEGLHTNKISVPSNVLHRGGWLRFDYQGKKYLVQANSSDPITLDPAPATGAPTDAAGDPLGVDFQFYPAPRKSSLTPIQLPSRAVVDMGLSGLGDTYGLTATPVSMIFTPTGEVERLYSTAADGTLQSVAIEEPLHLLIGKPGKTQYTADASDAEYENDEDAREDNNLLDGDNIWVTVDPRTGAIRSTEIRPVLGTAIDDGNLPQAVITARQFANGQSGSGN